MVDFDNDATIATPAIDVKRILILQDRQYLKEAIGAYKKNSFGGVVVEPSVVCSRLYELFLEVSAGLKRHISEKDYKELFALVEGNDFDKAVEAFHIIDEWLDKIGLTKVDVKQKLGGNIANRNKSQGWKA